MVPSSLESLLRATLSTESSDTLSLAAWSDAATSSSSLTFDTLLLSLLAVASDPAMTSPP